METIPAKPIAHSDTYILYYIIACDRPRSAAVGNSIFVGRAGWEIESVAN